MDSVRLFVWVVGVAGLFVACGDGDSSRGAAADEDERGSVGVPPPPGEYCTRLGFTIVGNQCQFPDATSCELWAFYRAECGQSHSYCQKQGGTVSTKTEDMGTWTAVYAVCDLNGKRCNDATFMQKGKCE